MATNCPTKITIDFEPPTVDFESLKVGLSYPFEFLFTDKRDGEAINIMSDGFALTVYDSLGAEVEIMTVGTGLTRVAGGILQGVFSSPTTDDAGRYTYKLIWTIPATGAEIPAAAGRIIVKA